MSEEDRTKWEARYAQHDGKPPEPAQLLVNLAELVPKQGKALEIAGGAGRNAIWLAQRGLDVTIADVSQNGLQIAQERARTAGVSVQTLPLDVDCDALPAGPWDLILCAYFLHRPLFSRFPELLRPGGLLVVIHPTMSNLQRHPKPPARFLLEDGELPGLVCGLEIEHYEQGWLTDERHEAVLVARRCRDESASDA